MKQVLLILLAFAGSSFAVLIPAGQTVDWTVGTYVGVNGGIPTTRTMFADASLAPYSADKTGVADATSAIQSAINACPANQYVYLPNGTYKMNGSIATKSNMTLRGESKTGTILRAATSGNEVIASNSSQSYSPYFDDIDGSWLVTAGLGAGSTTITVSGTTDFTVGSVILLTRHNSTDQFEVPIVMGTGDLSVSDFSYLWRLMCRVVSKTSTTITFFPALPVSWTGHTVYASPSTFEGSGTGLENLSIDGNSQRTNCVSWAIQHDSWIKNCKLSGTTAFAVTLTYCSFMEVIDNDFSPINVLAPNVAGVLGSGTCHSLFANNMIVNNRPGFEINSGSWNVVAYNFIYNDNGNLGIDMNHGGHGSFNLIEGNICNSVGTDGFHGSVSHLTWFRNWITGQDTYFTTGGSEAGYVAALKRLDRLGAMIGNVFGFSGITFPLGGDGLSMGQPHIGNSDDNGLLAPPWADFGVSKPAHDGFNEFDTGVASTMTLRANYYYAGGLGIPTTTKVRGANQSGSYLGSTFPAETLAPDTMPNSLYLSAKPTWFGNRTFPPIDSAAPGSPTFEQIYQKIPAGYRYVNGVDPPPGSTSETNPPTPNPMTFSSVPAATSSTAIAMTATAATDADGSTPIEYFFDETSGHSGGTDSGWQTSRTYSDIGLSPSTLYTYRVKARDSVLNETGYSSSANATTQAATSGTINIGTLNVTNLSVGP